MELFFYSLPKKEKNPAPFPTTLSHPIIGNLIIASRRRHQDECLCVERKWAEVDRFKNKTKKNRKKKTSRFLQWTTSFRRVSTDDKVLPAK